MRTLFSQRDPRWADEMLGASPYYTIGRAGCLLCAVASILADFEVHIPAPCVPDSRAPADGPPPRDRGVRPNDPTPRDPTADPKSLNAWLRDHDGYEDGCLFRFHAIADLGADLVELIRSPARLLTGRILDALDAGHPVVAEIPRNAATTHWVRIYAGVLDPGFTWYIMDPWQLPGAELTTVRRAYPRAKLRSIAVYAPSGPRGGTTGTTAGPTQDPQRKRPGPAQQALRVLRMTARDPQQIKINRDVIAAAHRALRGQ